MGADVRFPNIGIVIDSLGKSVNINGFSIAYYGMIIALGMVCGYFMASWQAGRLGQDKEIILDLALWDILFAVLGARIYYVIFSLDYYSAHPMEIFNIRGGGMAIYGGIIGGVVTTFVFARLKKQSFWMLADVACGGLLVGQIFGRWGNFFNREAFGDYTDTLLAMQLKRSDVRVSDLTDTILQHLQAVDGVEYIQVHPTFLYESLWNVLVLAVILWYTPKRKFDGQLFLMYLIGYGTGRFWIEGLRTDKLMLFGSPVAVSQLLSALLVLVALPVLLYRLWQIKENGQGKPLDKSVK